MLLLFRAEALIDWNELNICDVATTINCSSKSCSTILSISLGSNLEIAGSLLFLGSPPMRSIATIINLTYFKFVHNLSFQSF